MKGTSLIQDCRVSGQGRVVTIERLPPLPAIEPAPSMRLTELASNWLLCSSSILLSLDWNRKRGAERKRKRGACKRKWSYIESDHCFICTSISSCSWQLRRTGFPPSHSLMGLEFFSASHSTPLNSCFTRRISSSNSEIEMWSVSCHLQLMCLFPPFCGLIPYCIQITINMC